VVATERTAVAIELAGLKLRTANEQLESRPIARSWLTTTVEVLFVTTKSMHLIATFERTSPACSPGSTIVPVLMIIDHFRCCGRGTQSLA
jgi:hypothetical protein